MPTPADDRLCHLEARLEEALARIAQLESRIPKHQAPPSPAQTDPSAFPRDQIDTAAFLEESALASRLAAKKKELSSPSAPQSTQLKPRTHDVSLPGAKKKTLSTKQKKPSQDKVSLERFVGGKLFAIVGALIITSGVALFSKFAWDQGWFNTLSPPGKILMSASFGAALLGAARIVQAKINLKASIGAYAAGLGVLYATAYTAYGRFELVPHAVGFMLLAAVALLGISIGARTRLASIAAISLFGAYGTPLFFLDIDSNPIVLPAYLVSLIVLGLGLAAWMGGSFTRLRAIVWWGTVLFGAGWTLGTGVDNPFVALSFLAIAWASFHAELVYTSLHLKQTNKKAAQPPAFLRKKLVGDIGARILASSFSLTTWATVLAVIVFDSWKPGLDWLAPAGGVGATAFLALPLGAHLRVFRDRPETDSERLATALMMQCGALMIATIALGVSDWLSVFAWLGLGVAAAVCGTWLRSRPLHVYGIIVLLIASGRLLLLEWWITSSATAGITVYGLYLTRWAALVAGMGIAWVGTGVSVRIGAITEWKKVSNFCIGMGITGLFAALLHSNASGPAVAAVVVFCAHVVILTGHRLRSFGLCIYSLILLFLGLFVVVSMSWWMATATLAPFGVPLTIWTLLLLLSAAGAGITARLLLRFLNTRPSAQGLAVVCAAWSLAIAMAAFVNHATERGSLSMVWLALSAAVCLLGRRELRLGLPVIGLAGMLVSSLAWANAYAVEGWNEWTSPLMLHPGLLTSFAASAALFLAAREVMRMNIGQKRIIGGVGLATALVLVFTSSSFEAVRAAHLFTSDETSRKTFLSIWWGLFAVGLVSVGFWRRVPILRQLGLGLLSVAAIKTIAYDLVEIAPLWRVASFLGLGLLMLGVAAGYGKLSQQHDEDKISRSE